MQNSLTSLERGERGGLLGKLGHIFKDVVTIFERPEGSNCGSMEGLRFAGRKEDGTALSVLGGEALKTDGLEGAGEGLAAALQRP